MIGMELCISVHIVSSQLYSSVWCDKFEATGNAEGYGEQTSGVMSEKILFHPSNQILTKTTKSAITIMSAQNESRGARIHTAHLVWTQSEQEQLIQWLEEPENLHKAKKGSGISKKTIIAEIAILIPTKPGVKIGYKYDNLMKSYREAVKLNIQLGWGLSKGVLNVGRRYPRGMYIKLKIKN